MVKKVDGGLGLLVSLGWEFVGIKVSNGTKGESSGLSESKANNVNNGNGLVKGPIIRPLKWWAKTNLELLRSKSPTRVVAPIKVLSP